MIVSLDCPYCQSRFKVAEDQITQHQGLFCCGNCFTLFKAQGHTQANAENTNCSSDNLNKTTTKSVCKNSLAVFMLLLLLLSAVLQTVYFLRAEISWRYPSSQVYLKLACKKIGCDIALAKQINLLLLDDTDLLEDEQRLGLMYLSSSIVNQAEFSQAYPTIELTLTDIEDRAKYTRQFSPHEYLDNEADAKLGLAAGQSLKLTLPLANADQSIAGYRVRLFY
ncbi:Zinc finger/thioredoxin putative [Methylophilaceae bacterium]